MNILILEDNKFDADLTYRQISGEIKNCEIDIATSIQEAKSQLKTTYDVALIDLKLPDGYGTDILTDLYKTNNHMVIIMLTGSCDEEIVVTALKSGADDYIIKKEGYLNHLSEIILNHVNEKGNHLKQIKQITQVLYLEHHASDIDLTLYHFKRFASNFHFTVVASGEEVLKMLPLKNSETCKYHVLLMDYKLPGINAIELTKIIRQERKLDIPIIIVTGQGNEEIAIHALKLGVDEYLVKRENYLYRLPSLLTNAYQRYLLEKQNKELIESEERFRSIFEEHSAMKLIINPENGDIVSANKAASEFYGWTIEELTKMKIFEINTMPIPDASLLMNKIITKGGGHFEFQHRNSTGSINDVSVFSSKVILKEKEYLHSIIYDIGKRKKAEKQLKLLSTSVDQSPVSIVITNLSGAIEYINPYFTEVTGYAFEEIIGKNPRILNSGIQPKSFYKELWETILAGEKWQGEICNKKKNGEIFWENAIISPIKNEEMIITHFVGVKEDITEKKKMIDELIQAKEKAEESDRLKSSFLANMSHEIRTPMNGIIGFTNLISNNNLDSESRMRYANIIKSSTERLLRLLSDILDISKIEAGIIPLEKIHFNLNELFYQIEEEINTNLESLEKSHLKFKITMEKEDSESNILSARDKIHQVILNIVNNAIRFTIKGVIELGYRFLNGFVEIYVKDTGIGIVKEKQTLIFERFRQEDESVTRPFDGAGLGLTISKHLVIALGGEIKVESEKNKGSVFSFTVKIKNEEKQQNKVSQDEISTSAYLSLNGKLIYIAEDDMISYLYLEEILKESNAIIKQAKDGKHLLELIKDRIPDLILLDINMPVMNGFAAIKEIRKNYPKIPVIAQSAYVMVSEKQKILESGCNGYISKPIDKDELFAEIMKIV